MRNVYGRLVLWPSGNFGDSIVTAGLVRHFASQSPKIYLPVRRYNNNSTLIETVRLMFADLNNVDVIEHFDDVDYDSFAAVNNATRIYNADIFSINDNGIMICPMWDEQWYTWFGLPFSLRYQNFIVPENIPESKNLYESLVKSYDYIVVHREMGTHEQKLPIDISTWRTQQQIELLDKCQIIEINSSTTNNMMYYIDLIKNAKEIHCTPSSVFCFVDSLANKTSAHLYYHNIRANTIMRVNNQWNNYRWMFVNYNEKI